MLFGVRASQTGIYEQQAQTAKRFVTDNLWVQIHITPRTTAVKRVFHCLSSTQSASVQQLVQHSQSILARKVLACGIRHCNHIRLNISIHVRLQKTLCFISKPAVIAVCVRTSSYSQCRLMESRSPVVCR